MYRAAIDGLRERAVQILAELAARSPAGYSFEERNGLLFASDHGLALQGTQRPAIPKSHDDVMAMCRRGLRSGALAMLEHIIAARRDGIGRDDIAAAVDRTSSGGTFNTCLSDLRRNGLIAGQGRVCRANDILFPS